MTMESLHANMGSTSFRVEWRDFITGWKNLSSLNRTQIYRASARDKNCPDDPAQSVPPTGFFIEQARHLHGAILDTACSDESLNDLDDNPFFF